MTPVLKIYGGGFLLGTLLLDALAGIEVPKERNQNEFMIKYGKRLTKMQSRMCQPAFKFHIACCLASTLYLDKIMKTLFEEAACVEEARPGFVGGSRPDDDACEPGEDHWLRERTPSYRIQLCIHMQAAEIWQAMEDFLPQFKSICL